MPEAITPDIFKHLVDLAALELTHEQGEYLRGQLNNQLRSIQELVAIPLPDGTPLAAHGVPYTEQNSQAPREDAWIPFADTTAIIGQAPQVENGFIVVPDIPHTTLE